MTIPRIDGFDIFAWVRDNSAGTLWRARQRSLDRAVLLLVVNDGGDPARRDSLLAAARLAAQVNQPGLVGVLDVGQSADGVAYVVLDSYEGQSLLDTLAVSGPLPEGRLVSIAHSIADILSRAWATRRYVHRNLKPEDIFLLQDGTLRITGFASGSRVGDDGLLEDRSGEIVGTPSYMPPEQAKARPTLDMRADMYTLGGLLYHLATGHRPFEEFASDPLRLLGSLDIAQLPSPRETRPELSAGFETVLSRLLMKDPQDRYNSWGGLLQDLESLAVGKAPTIAPAFVPLGISTLRPAPAAAPAAPARVVRPPLPQSPDAPKKARTVPSAPSDEESVVDRVRRRERAASGNPVPTALWLVLFVALGYLGHWRWQHPDTEPTAATLLARLSARNEETPPPNPAPEAPGGAVTDARPFLPTSDGPAPVPSMDAPAAPAAPAAPTAPPDENDLPDYGGDDDFDFGESAPDAYVPAPRPSPVAAPPSAPAAGPEPVVQPPAPPSAPSAAAPAAPAAPAPMAQSVLAAVRQVSPDALRSALQTWSAEHYEEAVAAARALKDCGWPDDRLGERLARHDGPVTITQGERSASIVVESYVGGKIVGHTAPGRNGETRPVTFPLSSLDRGLRWTLYRECAPEGVSTEPENHAATALYALSAGDVSAFRAALPLSGGLEPVLRLVDELIRSRQ